MGVHCEWPTVDEARDKARFVCCSRGHVVQATISARTQRRVSRCWCWLRFPPLDHLHDVEANARDDAPLLDAVLFRLPRDAQQRRANQTLT